MIVLLRSTNLTKHIRKKAEEIAEATGEDPDVVEQQLIHRLESNIDWRKINRLLKDSRNGGLNKLIIPDPQRERKGYGATKIILHDYLLKFDFY